MFLTASLVSPKWNCCLCYSKYGLWTGSISIAWESVADAESTPDLPNDNLKIHSSPADSCACSSVRPAGKSIVLPLLWGIGPPPEHCTEYWCQIRLDEPQETDLPHQEPFLGVSSTSGLDSLPFLTNSFSICPLGSPSVFQWQGCRIWVTVLFWNWRPVELVVACAFNVLAWWPDLIVLCLVNLARICPVLTLVGGNREIRLNTLVSRKTMEKKIKTEMTGGKHRCCSSLPCLQQTPCFGPSSFTFWAHTGP